MNQKLQLSLPTLISLAATRGMLGVGAGLLLAPKIDRKRRRALGLTLLALGAASTIPIGVKVFGQRRARAVGPGTPTSGIGTPVSEPGMDLAAV